MSSAREIIQEVADAFGIRPIDITGVSRTRLNCMARWCVMARLSNKGWSTPRIGAVVNRHHTTVLNAMGRLSRGAMR